MLAVLQPAAAMQTLGGEALLKAKAPAGTGSGADPPHPSTVSCEKHGSREISCRASAGLPWLDAGGSEHACSLLHVEILYVRHKYSIAAGSGYFLQSGHCDAVQWLSTAPSDAAGVCWEPPRPGDGFTRFLLCPSAPGGVSLPALLEAGVSLYSGGIGAWPLFPRGPECTAHSCHH